MRIADCVVCQISIGRVPAYRVFENDRTFAFMKHDPISDGHVVVATVAHVESIYELPPLDCGAVLLTAKLVAIGLREALRPPGLTLMQANGAAAGQSTPHFSLHLVPRWAGNGLGMSDHATARRDRIQEIGERIRRSTPRL
ncbi:MAG: HIT domain-containing protein [Gammaproteobacteria bacterium]